MDKVTPETGLEDKQTRTPGLISTTEHHAVTRRKGLLLSATTLTEPEGIRLSDTSQAGKDSTV